MTIREMFRWGALDRCFLASVIMLCMVGCNRFSNLPTSAKSSFVGTGSPEKCAASCIRLAAMVASSEMGLELKDARDESKSSKTVLSELQEKRRGSGRKDVYRSGDRYFE